MGIGQIQHFLKYLAGPAGTTIIPSGLKSRMAPVPFSRHGTVAMPDKKPGFRKRFIGVR